MLGAASSEAVIHNQLRRTSSSAVVDVDSSSCQQFKSYEACHGQQDIHGQRCVWCKCSAVPSECVTEQQSKVLPSAVFDCEAQVINNSPSLPSSSFVASDHASIINSVSDQDDRVYLPGVAHVLTEDEVDRNLCDPDSLSLAGYMSIDGSKYDAKGENKHLFYWFFEKRYVSNSKDIPLLLWLTGGPGCSSSLALLTENGPCSVSKDGLSTIRNPYSWTETGHMLYLDQPAGVGYSYGVADDTNEEMISEDAYYFLQSFFRKHPEYLDCPLFIVGESYGGHYAPAIAHKIWFQNQKVSKQSSELLILNLKGLAVGNGLTNPTEQYKWYADMAFKNSHNIQVVTQETYDTMKGALSTCIPLIEKCNSGESIVADFACQAAFVVCNAAETAPYQLTGLNPYDIRKSCGDQPLCYDFTNIETFLNLDSTKKALHISPDSHYWRTCNMGINLKFHVDWMKDFSPYVRDLINNGIPTLIYAGDVDFICNYMGNRAWTYKLDWDHTSDFQAAKEHDWNGVGLVRSSNGFTFLQVYDAGHMVSELFTSFLHILTHTHTTVLITIILDTLGQRYQLINPRRP